MKFVFFSRPKPRQFTYRPRYWDPEKEEFERRKRQLDGYGDGERSNEEIRHDLRRQMETRWRRDRNTGPTDASGRWIRIFIYALIIFLGLYFIFFTSFIDNLVRLFTS